MSITTLTTRPPGIGAEKPMLLAVSYLRVSTREQAERGGSNEGFSIPARCRPIRTGKRLDLTQPIVFRNQLCLLYNCS